MYLLRGPALGTLQASQRRKNASHGHESVKTDDPTPAKP